MHCLRFNVRTRSQPENSELSLDTSHAGTKQAALTWRCMSLINKHDLKISSLYFSGAVNQRLLV
jgi:hypothetical protein